METKKRIEYSGVSDLKCDLDGCGYSEKIEGETFSDYINKPCPKCGSNLLTYEDFLRANTVMETVDYINALSDEDFEALSKLSPEMVNFQLPENKLFSMMVETHNEIKVGEIKEINNDVSVDLYRILDKHGIEMPPHYTGRLRTYDEAVKILSGLNEIGEFRPYIMVKE